MKKSLILSIVFSVIFSVSACALLQSLTLTSSPETPQILTSLVPAEVTTSPRTLVRTTPCLYTPSYYKRVELACETYVETNWGGGLTQWGRPTPPNNLSPLAFDSQSTLYFFDYVNHRLLKYDGRDPLPVQVISLPEYIFSDHFVPWRISITQSNIIIPHGLKNIAILSLDGREMKDLELPYSFNFMAPGWHPAWVDARGGILISGIDDDNEKVAYFDIGWENGEWREVSQAEDFIINPNSIKNPNTSEIYIIGSSGARFETYIYKVDPSKDFLKFRTGFDTGLDLNKTFIGADQQGWVYYMLQSDIARYPLFALSGRGQIGTIPAEISSHIAVPSVSPDGILYILTYSDKDMSVPPRIVKCAFPNQ